MRLHLQVLHVLLSSDGYYFPVGSIPIHYFDIPVPISPMKFIVLEVWSKFDFSSRLLVNDVNLSNLQANRVTYTTVCLRASHFWRR